MTLYFSPSIKSFFQRQDNKELLRQKKDLYERDLEYQVYTTELNRDLKKLAGLELKVETAIRDIKKASERCDGYTKALDMYNQYAGDRAALEGDFTSAVKSLEAVQSDLLGTNSLIDELIRRMKP